MSRDLPSWLATLYPFEPKVFTTPSGARMSYLDEGSGEEAVVMLHGNPTWSFYYRRLVLSLRPKIRCIAPDHIGMGLSEKPEDYKYTLERRIQDITALVFALGLTRIHLVVHDWGGAIGMGFAVTHPDLIGKIVLLNTAAFPDLHIPGRIAICRSPVVGRFLVRGLNGFARPATWMSMHRRKLSRSEKAAYLFPYDSWAARVAVHQFVADIPMERTHPTYPILQAIERTLPALANKQIWIFWGGKDFCFNNHFFARWKLLFPNAITDYLADVGHYVLEDSPETVRKIEELLLQGRT